MSTQNDLKENLIQKEESQNKLNLKAVSFLQLFKYSDGLDKLLMILGSLSSMASGATMPFFMVFFSQLTMIFIVGHEDEAQPKARDIAIKFFILGGITWFLSFAGLYTWGMTGQRQTVRFKKMYYKTLLQQEVAWYDSNDVNKLATEISGNMVAIETAMGQKMSVLLMTVVTSIFGFFYAYFKCWRLSLILTGFLPLMMFAGILMMKSMQIKAQINKISYEGAAGIAEQAFTAIKTVKSFVAQDFEEMKFVKALSESQKKTVKFIFFSSASFGLVMLIFLGLYSFGFWYAKNLVIWNLGDAATVIATFFCFMIGGSSVGQISPIMKNIAEAKVAAANLYDLMEREKTLIEPESGTKVNQIDLISFKNVTFKYKKVPTPQKEEQKSKLQPKDDIKKQQKEEDIVQRSEGIIKQQPKLQNHHQSNTVLSDVSLFFKKGKVTAIVGESGSGKSTIIQLLMRYYDPTEGNVFVNGLKMDDIDIRSLRRRIGYVGQQPALFSMTIAENLRLANPDLTDQQIQQILKKANALQFVQKCQNGINTYVGTGGAQISGGQKQRIAIARAIAKDPFLLILDQATSALDRKNQKQIQKTLNSLSEGNMTTIVVAHRLSTIRNADHIIVLGKGKILQQGTHQQLFSHEGPYFQLIKSQMAAQKQGQQKEQMRKKSPTKQIQPEIIQNANEQEQKNSSREKEQKKQEEPKFSEQKLNSVFGKLFKESKGTYGYLFVGCLAALLNGMIWPFFNIAFSNIMSKMAEAKKYNDDINKFCLLFLAVAVGGAFASFTYSFCFGIAGQKLVYKLRTKLFIKLLYLPASYFDKPTNTPGGISTKLSQDSYQINNMITGILGVVCLNISTITASLIFAFYYFWQLTLVVLAISPLLVITGAINMKVMKGMGQKSEKFQKAVGSMVSDTVCNIRTVKSFGNEEVFMKIFSQKLEEINKITTEKAFKSSFLQGLSRGSVMFVEGFTFWIAAMLFSKYKMSSNVGPQAIYIAIFSVIFAAMGVGQNSQFLPDMGKAKQAGASIFEILQSKDEVQQAKQFQDPNLSDFEKGEIEFKDVKFKYPERQAIVLKNFNLKIKKGEKIAIVGPSGSGKSTIVQILMRFYPLQSGQILVDGHDYKKYNLHKYRKHFGLVSQEPTLFLGTVKQNIVYNKQFKKDSLGRIEKYCRVVHAFDFINSWPQKYQKQVGQKGSQVSGGQKQRIALARCLIRQPKIIMLDQSTSALDADTEKIVFENLKPILKTSISIAHRLSTIQDANRIVVMRDGEIVEEGGYEELMEKKQNFYRLAKGIN